jgi:glutathione S-transferase
LPYLVVDDLKIPQSVSIARFLARRFNLAGRDEIEQVKTDVAVDTLGDLRNALYNSVFFIEDADEKEKARIKFLENAKNHLERVEKLVSQYGSNGHAVGSALTWADLELFEVTTDILSLYPTILEGLSGILGVRKCIESHEILGKYIKNRPITPY